MRDQNKPAAQALRQAGAELAEGDLNDRASLDRALQDVYGVFSVQTFMDGLDVEIRQGKTLADAALAAGVGHFVYSSVGSADRQTGVPHFDSKFTIEEHVRATGLPHTILRPVFFSYNFDQMRPMIDQGMLAMPLSPDRTLQQVGEADYARMVGDVFERPGDFLGRAIDVASSEMTLTDITATLGEVTGKAIRYQQVPFEAYQQQVGEELTTMFRWLEETGYSANLAALTDDFFEPTAFGTYLRGHGWAQPAESAA